MLASLKTTRASTAVLWLVTTVALYLTLLSITQLPCLGGGGCANVLKSSYSKVLGIPVGLLAFVFWTFVPCLPQKLYKAALAVFVVGCFGFVAVMVKLHTFCPYCTLHHVLAISLLFLPKPQALTKSVSLAILVALSLASIQGHGEVKQVPTAPLPVKQLVYPTENLPTVSLFGPTTDKSPILVLSLTCPLCLEKINTLLTANVPNPPKVLFLITPENRELTTRVISAAISIGKVDEGLSLVLMSLDKNLQNLHMTSYSEKLLADMYPVPVVKYKAEATELVNQMEVATKKQGWNAAPLLIQNGVSTTNFTVSSFN